MWACKGHYADLACRLLETSATLICHIGDQLGDQNEAAVCRAFESATAPPLKNTDRNSLSYKRQKLLASKPSCRYITHHKPVAEWGDV
jgi:hypothetical protein